MTTTTKRVLLILAALVLAAGCAFLADRIIFDNITEKSVTTEEMCLLTDGSEAYDLNGCTLSNHIYTVTGEDPHFTVFSNNAEFTRVRIAFTITPKENVALQMYYAPVMEGFSEENSVSRSIAAGLKEEIITIPDNAYTCLRFDFEQDVIIEGIYVSASVAVETHYAPHPVRITVVLLAVFIPLGVLAMKIAGKKKTAGSEAAGNDTEGTGTAETKAEETEAAETGKAETEETEG